MLLVVRKITGLQFAIRSTVLPLKLGTGDPAVYSFESRRPSFGRLLMPLRRVALSRVAFVCAGLFALASLVDCPTCRAADPPAAQPKVQRPRRQRAPRLPNSLIGRITDETGAPVADARVEIYPQGGGAVSFAKTQPDGSYALERVPS